MSQIILRFRAKDLRDDPKLMQLLQAAIQAAPGGLAGISVQIDGPVEPTGTRDPELEQQVARLVEKVLAHEATLAERAKQVEARLPDVQPRSAEEIVRGAEDELHRGLGRLFAQGITVAARIVRFGIEVARLFS